MVSYLNWYSSMKKIWKNLVDFWHRKLTLKVPFQHFSTEPHYVNLQNTTFSLKPILFSFFLIKASYFWIPKVYTKKWANFRLSNHSSKIQIFRINSLLFITGQNWRNAFRRGNFWRKIWLGSSQWHFVTSPKGFCSC